MNYVLKKGYISQEQNLHRFVEQVNNCVFTRRQLENQQTLASMVSQNLFSAKQYGFTSTELQLMLL
jgi:hypothetical protein